MGTLNGQRRFGEQALMDALFTTLKVVGVLVAVAVFQSAAAGYAGFGSAALLVLLAATWVTNRRHGALPARADSAPRAREILAFQVQTVGFMLVAQWVVQMDLWYVYWFRYEGTSAESAATAIYASSQLFAQISYSVVISLTFVLFPLISGLSLQADPDSARRYVREALRYALVMVVGIAAILTAAPEASIDLQLRDLPIQLEALPGGAEALRWLGLGYVFFALLFVLSSVLNAAGLPRRSLKILLVVAAAQCVGGYLLLAPLGLAGQAVASLVAMALGAVIAARGLARMIGPVIPWKTLCRTLLAGAAVYGLALAWHPAGKLITIARIAAAGIVYLLLVVAFREFDRSDLEKFRRVLPGRRRA
jgi:O-antigen/teichoic acid export membrane protein